MQERCNLSRGRYILLILLAALWLVPGSILFSQTPALMHYPDIHGDLVVFVYGGDIWRAPVSGGVARQLTIHDGDESFPKFSPDGELIAFTGEYDGNTDVYVMNPDGGNITRVTYHPGSDVVVDWHPTENKILFRSARHSYSRFYKLFLISPDSTGLEELILHEAVQGSFSPDASRFAYNKIAREHRNWKRYTGGLAQEIYLYNLKSNEEQTITDFEGTDRIPMWIGDQVFFSSDRDSILNIYSYDVTTGETAQYTHHNEYDVRFPSMGADRIVYQLGAELWLLDTRSGETARIPVEIRADAAEARPYRTDVQEYISNIDCSPSGERALITARGEIFTVPREHGPTRNLTSSSGARDRYAVWSPDGNTIAYLSGASGEYEIYLVDPQGKTDRVKLTQHDRGYRHTLRWSPDGNKIAFADQTLRLYYLDVNTREITEVDKANYENVDVSLDLKPISDYSWSPDSRYITYSRMDSNLMYQVYIYSLETGETNKVSQGLFSDFSPVFTEDGRHLIFASNRRFSPTLGDFEWEMVYKDVAGLYALTLQEDGQPLFPLRSDEVSDSEDDQESSSSAGDQVEIDFEGIRDRIEAFPLPGGNYRLMSVNESNLYYLNKEDGDFNRFEFRAVGPMNLHAFSFGSREEHTVIEGIDSYRLSRDGSHIVYKKGETVGIIEATVRNSGGNALDLSD
ncbi:MAG TPA: peptidase S41, partial [bacterium]|nr:peptidase S41 [bacterium]